jgi:serine/threonine protein kinase
LKILPTDVAAQQDRMRRFVQEAKAASALNHPNIITIHEIEQIDSVNFIATEFIDGQTLRQYLSARPMKIAEALDISVQIASALSASHAAGIIHRDIKPENVMLRRDGIVKVLDFGLAKLTADQSMSVDTRSPTKALFKTEPGTIVGTASYMSPEQARGLALDARTDIFSLGVVIYEMVTGEAPFGGATKSDLIVALLER